MERKVMQTIYHTGNGEWLDGSLYYEHRQTRRRGAKFKPTSEAQQRLNEENARRSAVRLLQDNFTVGKDFIIHLTYNVENIPADDERARKDLRNFILRVKRLYKRLGITENFKYFGTAIGGGKVRRHIHLVITGSKYPNLADEIRALWPFGYCNVDRVQDDGEEGLAGIASYICKNFRTAKELREAVFGKSWCCSKNLSRSEAHNRRGALPVSLLPKLAVATPTERLDILESIYPGYRAVEIDVAELSDAPEDRKHRIYGNYYIYLRMRRKTTNHTKQKRR